MFLIHIFIFLSELWPLSVTFTLALGILIWHVTLRLTMVNICTKLYWHVKVLFQTSVFQLPLSVTLTIFVTWWLYGPNTHFHIFIWTLTPMCDLDHGRRDLYFACGIPTHSGEHLCQIILKSLYACRSFAPDKLFTMTSKLDLDLWPRDLVHAQDTASHSVEHF
jgi:hypothetical protein